MAHNMFIEQIISFGIIGNVLLIAMLIKITKVITHSYKVIYPDLKGNFYGSLPIWLLFLGGMVSHSFVSFPNVVLFFIGVNSIYFIQKKWRDFSAIDVDYDDANTANSKKFVKH